MKLETAALITKGFCYVIIGGLTPMATGLGQWANEGAWPSDINWVVILAGCAVGAATQMLSFLSQSYGNYKLEMKNGNPPGRKFDLDNPLLADKPTPTPPTPPAP